MGGVVDSVGDVLGGAADFVGDVAGGIGDFAGDVVEDYGKEIATAIAIYYLGPAALLQKKEHLLPQEQKQEELE
jgi:hypothetical protein